MEESWQFKAVRKLAEVGEQAGFSIEQMIDMLNAGIGVETLLEIIEQQLDGMVPENRSSRKRIA